MDTLQTAISRAAKLAWVFEHHGAWGWQHEDPRRWGEKRSAGDSLVMKWEKDMTSRVNKLVDRYLAALERREDTMSPHASPKPSLVLSAYNKAPDRNDRCPDCGTRLISIGAF